VLGESAGHAASKGCLEFKGYEDLRERAGHVVFKERAGRKAHKVRQVRQVRSVRRRHRNNF
jgi:hypothetical protein